MISDRVRFFRSRLRANAVHAQSTIAFAAIGDHVRLPARFFPRLHASDSSRAL